MGGSPLECKTRCSWVRSRNRLLYFYLVFAKFPRLWKKCTTDGQEMDRQILFYITKKYSVHPFVNNKFVILELGRSNLAIYSFRRRSLFKKRCSKGRTKIELQRDISQIGLRVAYSQFFQVC